VAARYVLKLDPNRFVITDPRRWAILVQLDGSAPLPY
jgi:hypothetical protein